MKVLVRNSPNCFFEKWFLYCGN